MNIVESNFDYELQFAVSVAVTRFATWQEYATALHLNRRFTTAQVAEIKSAYDRWQENYRQAGFGFPVTAFDGAATKVVAW